MTAEVKLGSDGTSSGPQPPPRRRHTRATHTLALTRRRRVSAESPRSSRAGGGVHTLRWPGRPQRDTLHLLPAPATAPAQRARPGHRPTRLLQVALAAGRAASTRRCGRCPTATRISRRVEAVDRRHGSGHRRRGRPSRRRSRPGRRRGPPPSAGAAPPPRPPSSSPPSSAGILHGGRCPRPPDKPRTTGRLRAKRGSSASSSRTGSAAS